LLAQPRSRLPQTARTLTVTLDRYTCARKWSKDCRRIPVGGGQTLRKHNRLVTFGISAALALVGPLIANATELELIYSGVFNSQDSLAPASGSGGSFTTPTPFTINAWFDTSSPNLAPPSPPAPPPFAGFRAFDPTLATITVGGTTYTFDTISTNPTAGVTVAIFDNN